MAGSNQAIRLQGMLSDLAGSFSMENMGGAGQAFAQNIRDSSLLASSSGAL